MSTLFVGNLAAAISEPDLKELFGRYGEVESVNLMIERSTGRHRGFALIKMVSGAEAAILEVNGRAVSGRRLAVNMALVRPTRPVPSAKLA